jgi:hypothetical protein
MAESVDIDLYENIEEGFDQVIIENDTCHFAKNVVYNLSCVLHELLCIELFTK